VGLLTFTEYVAGMPRLNPFPATQPLTGRLARTDGDAGIDQVLWAEADLVRAFTGSPRGTARTVTGWGTSWAGWPA
jgi:hypothetical protein